MIYLEECMQMKRVSVQDEKRRQDRLSGKMNSKLTASFKRTQKIAKALKITGMIITVALSVYSLIPKEDELPGMDNQLYEVMSD